MANTILLSDSMTSMSSSFQAQEISTLTECDLNMNSQKTTLGHLVSMLMSSEIVLRSLVKI